MKDYNFDLLDDEGYPTDEYLDFLADYKNFENYQEVLELIEKTWWMPDWGLYKKKPFTDKLTKNRYFTYYMSTGGWSGNESIINSLEKNFMFMIYWRQSRVGGHYKFRFPVK